MEQNTKNLSVADSLHIRGIDSNGLSVDDFISEIASIKSNLDKLREDYKGFDLMPCNPVFSSWKFTLYNISNSLQSFISSYRLYKFLEKGYCDD